MFENLTNRLSDIIRNISGHSRLTEKNIKDAVHEVYIALLDADVSLSVVRIIISKITKHALGKTINREFTPGQELIKIVKHELTLTMGDANSKLNFAVQPPAVILMLGLQGTGKTTSVGKLGKFIKTKHKKKVLTVSTDIYRPAAIQQLEKLAQEAGIDFYPSHKQEKPIDIVNSALKQAKIQFYDVLIVDTAGRLHIDDSMMNEIKKLHVAVNPIETLLVVDAMTGQDAANIAVIFNKILPLTGVVLTKVDGDARGGAALSIRHLTGKPIKFLGVGEKTDALEPFYPDRIASRILGMGDVLSLIDDIKNTANQVQTQKMAIKLKKGYKFDLNDFQEQLKQIRNMGGMNNMLNKIPGMNQLSDNIKLQMDNKVTARMEAIINSMTLEERAKPEIIKGSHRRRIASGSGVQVQDINFLLKQFNDMQRIMKKIKNGGVMKIMRNIKGIMLPGFPNS
ncbi:signal recognition particle protein [Candidatus Fukatsuia anoeciicola]|uniref:signal recognition particle protein n=1 Tax=Candidatus Fukatsuia anoeciicola TaxID=2994492 RepID=UPI003464B13C